MATLGCGRTDLEQSAPVGSVGASAAGAGGASSAASDGFGSWIGGTLGTGGIAATTGSTGGTPATGGAPGCPRRVPNADDDCTGNSLCAYVVADHGCCQETASARCKDGHWAVATTECDCLDTGGRASSGGSAGVGGAPAGGTASSGGSSAMPGTLGCRGEALGHIAKSCDLLIPAQPGLVQLGNAARFGSSPLGLARATDDARCVSVVTTQSETDTTLFGASFEPWSSWPAQGTIAPLQALQLPDKPSGTFALGPSSDHRLTLAWQTQTSGTMLSWDLNPDTFEGTHRLLEDAHTPLVVSASEIGHFVAVHGSRQQSMRVWSYDESEYTAFPGACADTDVTLGVEPYKGGFLWATSTGSNNTGIPCRYSTETPGDATRIEIGQVTDVCCAHSIWNFEMGARVTNLKTAPHPDGLWIVWQTEVSEPRHLYWMRIGFDPTIVLGPGSVEANGDVPADFAIASIDRKLAVAWDNEVTQPRLAVALIDETGHVSRSDPLVNVPTLRNLAMIGGPTGAGVLIGFADGNLLRMDCAEWE